MEQKIGVYGLGAMGFGIAQSLLKTGYKIFGCDVNVKQVERLCAEGGKATTNVLELDAVCIVVLNAQQTEQVLFGQNGVVPAMASGAVVISCATVDPSFAKKMEKKCAEYNVHYLDAPISGGAVKAARGALTVIASGTDDAFIAAAPVLDAIATTVFKLGDTAGAGSAMKAVNQLLAGVHLAAMAEALTFGMTQGISPGKFVDVITQCAGTSWMLEDRAPHIVLGDYTPHSSVDIWPKDLGIVLEIAKSVNFSAPLTTVALQQFFKASSAGLGREDDAAITKIYALDAGLTLPGVS